MAQGSSTPTDHEMDHGLPANLIASYIGDLNTKAMISTVNNRKRLVSKQAITHVPFWQ
jgi:hypothetical protein